jgi:hypothetical protein
MIKRILVMLSLISTANAQEINKASYIYNQTEFIAFDKASQEFLKCFGPKFTNTPKGHIQTDIAGASSIAGLMLLRDINPNMDDIKPGSVMISEVYEGQTYFQHFMIVGGNNMGLNISSKWTEVPSRHNPLMNTEELTRKLEPLFYEACKKYSVPKKHYSHAACLAAVKLISAGDEMKILDPKIGMDIAIYNLVSGSKTVPYPLEKEPNQ